MQLSSLGDTIDEGLMRDSILHKLSETIGLKRIRRLSLVRFTVNQTVSEAIHLLMIYLSSCFFVFLGLYFTAETHPYN